MYLRGGAAKDAFLLDEQPMKHAIIWFSLFVIQALLQFAAWSLADATANNGWIARALMFPAFTIAGPTADRWFWPTFVTNSFIWATCGTFLIAKGSSWARSSG